MRRQSTQRKISQSIGLANHCRNSFPILGEDDLGAHIRPLPDASTCVGDTVAQTLLQHVLRTRQSFKEWNRENPHPHSTSAWQISLLKSLCASRGQAEHLSTANWNGATPNKRARDEQQPSLRDPRYDSARLRRICSNPLGQLHRGNTAWSAQTMIRCVWAQTIKIDQSVRNRSWEIFWKL